MPDQPDKNQRDEKIHAEFSVFISPEAKKLFSALALVASHLATVAITLFGINPSSLKQSHTWSPIADEQIVAPTASPGK